MEHAGTLRLESARLLLRPFVLGDADAMFRNWASDAEVTRFLTWSPHADRAATQALLETWTAQYADPAFYQWAIVPKSLGEPIGAISVVQPIDARIRAAEIGYCIGRPWWHEGITSEAFSLVIDLLSDRVGVNKIVARHDTENPRSGRVMQRCGLRREGTLRQAGWNNRGICDLVYYGLLKSERAARKDTATC